MKRVEGKIAIVTGGASGIGRATAERLAEEGAKLVVTDIDATQGKEVVEGIKARGGEAVFMVQDVVDETVWEEVVKLAVDSFGGLNILVNNAGIGIGGAIADMTLEDWRRQRRINLDGVFLGTKHAIPAMTTSGGGSIVNISSVAGLKGAAGLAAYNATKGGVRLFTKSTAKECAAGETNIRANSVHPGIIDTPIWTKITNMGEMPEELGGGAAGANAPDIEAMSQLAAPMARSGKVVEIANGILFLASDESSYMTGTELVIDGGLTA